MKRREFIQLAASASLLAAAPRAFAFGTQPDAGWRTFDLTYTVDLAAHDAAGRIWLPL
ncbi:MAG: transglutaminase, partial [Gallionella sp.]|nr:transglutaminase [Gallionella sp.]